MLKKIELVNKEWGRKYFFPILSSRAALGIIRVLPNYYCRIISIIGSFFCVCHFLLGPYTINRILDGNLHGLAKNR